MIAAATLLITLTLSILITRVATVALTLTGLSRESARFQARSAFTGVGFTTNEAESVVNHPVRRRILMTLMLLGNAGIVTVVASMMLTFVDERESANWVLRVALLIGGVAALLTATYSRWLDRHLTHIIRYFLAEWTDIDVRDYHGLLHLGGDYTVVELNIRESDWLANQSLARLSLSDEGIIVLGVHRRDGEYQGVPTAQTKLLAGDTVLLYGRADSLQRLDRRRRGVGGEMQRLAAVAERKKAEREAAEQDTVREQRETLRDRLYAAERATRGDAAGD